MNEFRADLHCHTTQSDGTATPEELLHLAKQVGLSGLCITDHDSIDAYQFALPLAKELGIEMISGAEFSAIQDDVSVHILGYAFNLNSPAIHEFCRKHHARRTNRNRAILELLAQHNMPISEDELPGHDPNATSRSVGRPHIALAMIKHGYVKSVNDAFHKFLGDGKCCFSSGESFTVQETLDVIHEAKGLAVIAHPHLLNSAKILQQILTMDFDGIEGYYANFAEPRNRRWLRIAEKNNWLITGGSDYHGYVKPQINLGASWVPEDTFRVLQKHYEEVNKDVLL